MADKADDKKKYENLGGTFLNGSLKGQINSVYKDRQAKPGKVEDFKAAIKAGDVKLGNTVLSKGLVAKLVELGVDVPKNLVPSE